MYTIKKASELTDIPTVTIRAWENRYHIVNPSRSEGGHRLYSDDDIHILKWFKHKTEFEHYKISDAVRLWHQQDGQVAHTFDHFQGEHAEEIQLLYNHLTHYRSSEANERINLAFSKLDYDDVIHHIFVPILYQIGDEWERGHLSVAQEHFASEFIMQRCMEFFRILPINKDLPKAVAFTPEKEHHHIGLLTFSLFLRKQGLEVLYLGPNTPYDHVIHVLDSQDVKIVALSLTYSDNHDDDDLNFWLDQFIKRYPNIEFAIGGVGLPSHELTVTSNRIHDLNHQSWTNWYDTLKKRSDDL
ncbi:DNA-binding transcriptional MerR regulator [Alkalibacillus flavidus]|uniref:DNA-binding transcriptional MerR regulator n=1 Tax=Alkalibacillus flavidus TaxID=546021 RepID=A0ABV2KVX9_9BACI